MNELECPYCKSEIKVPNDEGFLEQYTLHQHQCDNCKNYFIFETEIEVVFRPNRADCLNDGKHTWAPTKTYPVKFAQMRCTQCGECRKPNPQEMEEILNK